MFPSGHSQSRPRSRVLPGRAASDGSRAEPPDASSRRCSPRRFRNERNSLRPSGQPSRVCGRAAEAEQDFEKPSARFALAIRLAR